MEGAPSGIDPEGKSALMAALRGQREHVLGSLEGLGEGELRRRLLPSGWTCVGLVQHLALDVERFWFWQVVEGGRVPESDQPANAWEVAEDTDAAQVLERYRQEIERSNQVIEGTAIDAEPRWWPADLFGSWRLRDLREILIHVVTETAVHSGHRDAVRELIDGRQWLVLK